MGYPLVFCIPQASKSDPQKTLLKFANKSSVVNFVTSSFILITYITSIRDLLLVPSRFQLARVAAEVGVGRFERAAVVAGHAVFWDQALVPRGGSVIIKDTIE